MQNRICLVCRLAEIKRDAQSKNLFCNEKSAFVHQFDSCKKFEALASVAAFADNYRADLPQLIGAK